MAPRLSQITISSACVFFSKQFKADVKCMLYTGGGGGGRGGGLYRIFSVMCVFCEFDVRTDMATTKPVNGHGSR